jgi:hypothetical protein
VPQGTLQHEEARNTKDRNEEATPEIDDQHAITGKPKPSRDQVHVLNAPVAKSEWKPPKENLGTETTTRVPPAAPIEHH